MTVTEEIKEAILKAAAAHGSQAKVAAAAGITPTALSRYLNGRVSSINAATWNIMYPVLEAFLPEGYGDLAPAPPREAFRGPAPSPVLGMLVLLRDSGEDWFETLQAATRLHGYKLVCAKIETCPLDLKKLIEL